ncbi:ribonuclease H-like domain-containing protein [Tanacetum coccineum]
MTGNKAYLDNFSDLNVACFAFGGRNIVPSGGLACLIAKATTDESNKWHRRLGHVNFKNLNKLVKGNLVRGLPSKIFQNDHTCVACQKGKQHKASCKAKAIHSYLTVHYFFWAEAFVLACYVLFYTSSENQANLHAGQQEANQNAGTEEIIDAGESDKEDESC